MLWIAVCTIAGIALVLFSLVNVSKQEDQRARRCERKLDPLSDVTLTR